ncbi:MAG: CatB-related O-acetyltransferase [Lachnospiraceae bacterium]|nr:CatB-related O-acetyltransferase [Lachnospiraceae bacterium]
MFQEFIVKMQMKGYYLYYKLFSKKYKICLGKKIQLDSWTEFMGNNRIGDYSVINRSKIGLASYMGKNCKFIKTDIGKYTSIASGVCIVSGHHPINEYISTSPVFYSVLFGGQNTFVDKEYYSVYKYADEENARLVCIGNDVWLGEGVKIVEGVTIGDGVVVAAYSVVTKNLEPYGVYAGVPAKLIKYRFEQEVIEKLENFKWWDKDQQWLKSHADIFRNPEKFFDVLGYGNGVNEDDEGREY